MKRLIMVTCFSFLFISCKDKQDQAQTIALWLFDEPTGLYPSHVMDDASENDHPLVIGPGGQIVAGKFGNGLSAEKRPPIVLPAGEEQFGLKQAPKTDDRKVEPLSWMNAGFCALILQ